MNHGEIMWPLIFSLLSVVRADEYCRALTLESGGSRGAYQVGVMLGLSEMLPGSDIEWNVVTGISTGSISAAGVSYFAMGQEAEMAQYLKSVWLGLNGSASIYEDWNSLGVPYGLLFEQGMYSTAPLRNTLSSVLTHPPLRNVTVGTTNVNTGKYSTFNESLGMDFIEAVMCSTSAALFFPPQHFQGDIWGDGGWSILLDVFTPIERCLDVVSSESQVIVDIIFCSGSNLDVLPKSSKLSVKQVLSRVSAVRKYDKGMWYAYTAMSAYPDVNFRYLFVPSASMPGGVEPLDFNRTNLENEMALGTRDAYAMAQERLDPRQLVLEWKQTRYNQVRPFSR